MRAALPLLFVACSSAEPASLTDGSTTVDSDGEAPSATACPTGKAGAACILELHDAAAEGCEPDAIDALRSELEARAELGPLWANGRALFRSATPIHVAGSFNDWSPTALETQSLCGSDLVLATAEVATGHHQYKLTDGASWTLDPANPAFAYDDFSGNPDGTNSVLATPDSGRGYLVRLDEACSPALGNCRDVTAYLPPGYDTLANEARKYPVLFMHDGQNAWDDHDCCFGHTGWETNVALDTEIAAGRVAPVIVIAAAHSAARNDEYGLSATKMATFMEFQVSELQPRALAQVRWDGAPVAIAGSSLGGLVSMFLALTYPEAYGAVASLSGAFWPGQDTGSALRDRLPQLGKHEVAIYLDHGGDPSDNSDGAADSVEIRDLLDGMGWQLAGSPACTRNGDALCYFHEPGATHDELAWKARTWRFLRYLFPPT